MTASNSTSSSWAPASAESVRRSSSNGSVSTTSSSSTARTTSAAPGTSTTTRAWPSTFPPPPTRTSSSPTRTGRGCSRRARRSSSTPTTWPTSTTCAGTCGSTPASRARGGTRTPSVWQVALADGETLTTRYLITATGFLSQPRMPDIPGIDRLRRQGHPHHRLGRRLRPGRAPDRHHRHRRHRRPAHPRAGQDGRRADRLSAHPDLGGAEDRPPVRRAGQAAVRPGSADAARRPSGDRRRSTRSSSTCGAALPEVRIGSTSRASDLAQDAPLRLDPRQGAAGQADPGLRLRLQAADVLQRLLPHASPSRTCTCRPTASTTSQPTASSTPTAPRR